MVKRIWCPARTRPLRTRRLLRRRAGGVAFQEAYEGLGEPPRTPVVPRGEILAVGSPQQGALRNLGRAKPSPTSAAFVV